MAQGDPAKNGRKAGSKKRGRAKGPAVSAEQPHGGEQQRFPVCHKGKTLVLPLPAVLAHLDHGDTAGTCGSLQGGACVSLLQICHPSFNPCCDKAACAAAQKDEGSALHFCLDKGCTSDQECLTRYPDDPD